jgi:hypothetical protein
LSRSRRASRRPLVIALGLICDRASIERLPSFARLAFRGRATDADEMTFLTGIARDIIAMTTNGARAIQRTSW